MKRKLVIALVVAITSLSACGKTDNTEPVISEAVEVEEENTVDEVENIMEDEPVQEDEEADTVDTKDSEQEIETDTENTDEPTIQIEVTPLDKIMYAQSDVNTRLGDSTDYAKVGLLTTNQEIKVTGQSKSTGWYQIDIDGVEQFVSDKYLADSKVEIQQQSQSSSKSSTSSSSSQSQQQQQQQVYENSAPDAAPNVELSQEAIDFWNNAPSGGHISEGGGNYDGFKDGNYWGGEGITAQ